MSLQHTFSPFWLEERKKTSELFCFMFLYDIYPQIGEIEAYFIPSSCFMNLAYSFAFYY